MKSTILFCLLIAVASAEIQKRQVFFGGYPFAYYTYPSVQYVQLPQVVAQPVATATVVPAPSPVAVSPVPAFRERPHFRGGKPSVTKISVIQRA